MHYEVVFEPFTERHFIKNFSKKYKNAWHFTRDLLQKEFEQVELLFQKSIAEVVMQSGKIMICKTEFKISGTQESRHGSGNRSIIAIHKDTRKVHVLLVYHKRDIGEVHETANWKRIIKENYPAYKAVL